MVEFSLENVQALASEAYIPRAEAAFGAVGAERIRSLLNSIKLIYQRFPPEALEGTLTVVAGVSATPQLPLIQQFGQVSKSNSSAEVGAFLKENAARRACVVEVLTDGSYRHLALDSDVAPQQLSQAALVYHLDADSERILAKDHDVQIPRISSVLRSNFAAPTLQSLEEALKRYSGVAAETKCAILKDVWVGGVDGPRLVLVNKPESIMRDSLITALGYLLSDVTVRPEHNTDETKPVDIVVNWFASGAHALIEVKWLGRSIAVPTKPRPNPTYTDYHQARAQEGAKQLADYLDREVRHTDAIVTKGYLVVFDARRKSVKGADDALAAPDATAFANVELAYAPDYSSLRSDFATPVRFFMKPRQSYFLAA